MNGNMRPRYGGEDSEEDTLSDYARPSMDHGLQQPNGAVILNGYGNDIINGFESEKRLNPNNTTRPQSSMLLNVHDPIQVHLLVETALGDSSEYEVLSQEEVDELKKQVSFLTSRIEQTRENLAIQSKYRDAAVSMSKLYSPKKGGKRGSTMHHKSDSIKEADLERLRSEEKCEELASELFGLEKRLMEPQNRLLKHTAGILQMTHKGPKKVSKGQGTQPTAIPGSPESMYTYHNARLSMDPVSEEDFFDERSLYRSVEKMDADSRDSIPPPPRAAAREQLQMIAKTEQKLQDLNARLREVIINANPRLSSSIGPPPTSTRNSIGKNDTSEAIQNQLKYLEEGISAMNDAPRARGGSDEEVDEGVLVGLWNNILSGYEGIRQRKEERMKLRSEKGLPPDEDDLSEDENEDPNEPFSLPAFSTKVQWLYAQATQLKEQKKVLQRQIKQQRELNSKSDATKDSELRQKVEELERVKSLLERTEIDSNNVREQLADVLEKHNDTTATQSARAEIEGKLSASEAKIASLTEELMEAVSARSHADLLIKQTEDELSAKEKEMDDMNQDIARLQTEVTIARAELDGAYGTRAQRAAEVAANPVIQKEIDDLNSKNTSLSTEIEALKAVTAAGNQGSKEDHEKMRTLKRELEETIEEYEIMTKASIEWEKEREKLEETIDKLRDERENLETLLSDEKVRWLGMRSPTGESPVVGAGSTSTTVLRNEFKKMMRDTRAESARALRAEITERRRLEDELRAMKRAQGPGKSSLSQSMAS